MLKDNFKKNNKKEKIVKSKTDPLKYVTSSFFIMYKSQTTNITVCLYCHCLAIAIVKIDSGCIKTVQFGEESNPKERAVET